MRILTLISGEYGRRHVANIQAHGPRTWELHTWQAPPSLPPLIDDPREFLPISLPGADLILSFGEHPGIAELLPEIVKMTGAKAVIAAIDNEAWMPRGLARQLRGWLAEMGVECATPKPLCSLTEIEYGVTLRERIAHDSPWIAEFAHYFGQPDLQLAIDPRTRIITSVEVLRDAVCGCARFVAQGLIGSSVDEVEEKAGLLHHHYPCMASMQKDPDFNFDTLMHASGNLLKARIAGQIRPFIQFVRPGNRSEE
jgi:hypothetical protein